MTRAAAFFAVVAITALAITMTACGSSGGAAPNVSIQAIASATPALTPIPKTWLEDFHAPHPGAPVQLSCLDTNGDRQLTADDEPRFEGLEIALDAGKACVDPSARADFYATDEDPIDCATTKYPVGLIVLVGGGGTDLLQGSEGESLGLLKMLNDMQQPLEASVDLHTIIAASAIFGAVPPQGSMERYLAAEIGRRLEGAPCLRAVVIGHSHGGVVVTAVLAALEDRFADRLYGILIDRSAALYDGDPAAMPQQARLLNVFQLNEGWHGVAINQPNVENLDESALYAPLAPSDGGSGSGRVSHKTLDDAADLQVQIEYRIVRWLGGQPKP
jgi:pimeloyl-ACP methyl ester carboxylesterase